MFCIARFTTLSLPSLYEPTIFGGSWSVVTPSPFIRPMHPKTEIRPDPAAIRRILNRGWCAQKKIHGHRAQIHIPADKDQPLLVFNRQGQVHKKDLEDHLEAELRRLFTPKQGWNVIDAEWLKPEKRIYIFDYIKFQDKILSSLPFGKRFEFLPRIFSSDCLEVLPLIKTVQGCMDVLNTNDELIEGLVLKSMVTPGFHDSSIVRCRKVMFA